MSIARRIFFGAAASWVSRGATILLGLALLPVLFRTLQKEELGIWLLIGQSVVTLGILDFGFGVTLTRRIAFAKGKSGSAPDSELSDVTRNEIADLLATGLHIYRSLAVFSFIIALSAGYFYLRSLELDSVSAPYAWIAWGILCLSSALNMWAAPWICLLQGVGYIGWDAILVSFAGAATLIGQILAVSCGGGLISLAVVAMSGALLQRALILGFARRKRPDLFHLRGKWSSVIFRGMVPLATRAWFTALGGFMVFYTDQFVIASLQGASELPAYRAAWVLVHNITVVATIFGVASGVFVSHLWQSQEINQVHRIVERNVRLGWLIFLLGATVLLNAGEALFTLWLGHGNFIGYPVLVAFLVTEALETQSYVISSASRATGDEAFAWSSIAAGVLKLILSIVLASHLGLLGVALGTVISLILTNHWYVPWRGLKALRFPRRQLFRGTVLPVFLWFLALNAFFTFLKPWIVSHSLLWQVGCVSAATGVVMAIALWILVFEQSQKDQIVAYLRNRLFPV